MNDRTTGQRFSLTYLSQGDPSSDSQTMRYRLGKLLEKNKYQPQRRQQTSLSRQPKYVADHRVIQVFVEEEIGCQFNTVINGRMFSSWVRFLTKIPINKLLDTITIAYKKMHEVGKADDFISEVNRIFREENVAYEVDDEGGVHPAVDSAFSANKQATILGMNDARYALSLIRVNEVDMALMSSPPDYIQSIRSIFGANENLFKLMYSTPRLDARSANDKIGRQLQSIYAHNPTMQRASSQILNSFSNWIDAAHHYRHEAGREEPNQPDSVLAILLISQGMSFVRWLVGIDKSSRSE